MRGSNIYMFLSECAGVKTGYTLSKGASADFLKWNIPDDYQAGLIHFYE